MFSTGENLHLHTPEKDYGPPLFLNQAESLEKEMFNHNIFVIKAILLVSLTIYIISDGVLLRRCDAKDNDQSFMNVSKILGSRQLAIWIHIRDAHRMMNL